MAESERGRPRWSRKAMWMLPLLVPMSILHGAEVEDQDWGMMIEMVTEPEVVRMYR